MNLILSFDWQILSLISHLHCAFLDVLMPFLSNITEYGLVWILPFAIPMLCKKSSRRWGIVLLIVLATGLLVGEFGIKQLAQRVRPCNTPGFSWPMLVQPPQSYSFPSSHSMNSFAAATVLFLFNRRIGQWAGVLASGIAFSRLYLFVHFPTDVLCGCLMGIGWALLVVWLLQKAGVCPPLKRPQRTPESKQ